MLKSIKWIGFCVLILVGNVSFGYQDNANETDIWACHLTVDILPAHFSFSDPRSNSVSFTLGGRLGSLLQNSLGRYARPMLGIMIRRSDIAHLIIPFYLRDREQGLFWFTRGEIVDTLHRYRSGDDTFRDIVLTPQRQDLFLRRNMGFFEELVRATVRNGLLYIAEMIHENCDDGHISLSMGVVEKTVLDLTPLLIERRRVPLNEVHTEYVSNTITGMISRIFLEELTSEYLEGLGLPVRP